MNIPVTKDDIFELIKPDGGKFAVADLSTAYDFCKKITLNHYENFPVGSVLIPKDYRSYFYSVYAFSRLADDIADELTDYNSNDRIEALNNLLSILKKKPEISVTLFNPIILALQDTIIKKVLPIETFEKLIKAFVMDSDFNQPLSMDDNTEYCKYSANPVGELVLRIFDNYNEKTAPLSEAVCTALQLVNFWQDISLDRLTGRNYIPVEILKKYDLDENLHSNINNQIKLRACLKDIYDFTENLFIFGVDLVKFIKNKRLKYELALTIESGKRILEKVRNYDTDIIKKRPKLTKKDVLIIIFRLITKYGFSGKWK